MNRVKNISSDKDRIMVTYSDGSFLHIPKPCGHPNNYVDDVLCHKCLNITIALGMMQYVCPRNKDGE